MQFKNFSLEPQPSLNPKYDPTFRSSLLRYMENYPEMFPNFGKSVLPPSVGTNDELVKWVVGQVDPEYWGPVDKSRPVRYIKREEGGWYVECPLESSVDFMGDPTDRVDITVTDSGDELVVNAIALQMPREARESGEVVPYLIEELMDPNSGERRLNEYTQQEILNHEAGVKIVGTHKLATGILSDIDQVDDPLQTTQDIIQHYLTEIYPHEMHNELRKEIIDEIIAMMKETRSLYRNQLYADFLTNTIAPLFEMPAEVYANALTNTKILTQRLKTGSRRVII